MFSREVTETDAFMVMPSSSQALYFHLGMNGDDDGFVSNPKTIIRSIGASEDDLKILSAKRFIILFDSGIVVIKHWKLHNLIRSDRYKETTYLTEKTRLSIKDNNTYTEIDESTSKTIDNQMSTSGMRSIV